MKIKTTFSCFIKATLGIVLINALSFHASAQGPGTISKPGYEEYYEYDNASWVHIYNTTYTYDSIGRMTMAVNTTPNSNQNISKREFTLTINGNTRSNLSTSYVWQNNAWVTNDMFNSKDSYNAANQLTETIWQDYRNNVLTNARKKEFVYDAASNLTEETEYLWQNNAWQNFYRSTYTYAQGTRTERLISKYNTTTASWETGGKHIYTGWHTPNLQPLVTVHQAKDPAGNWINTTRYTYTPGSNGSHVILTESFVNNSWVNGTRSTVIYDAQGNRTDQFTEGYVNGAWQLSINSKFLNTYTPQNDLQQIIIQGQDSANAPLKNEVKYVYSNFQYFNRSGLGVHENQLLKTNVSVFPNPATHKINIRLEDLETKTLTATVKDITGKTWLTKTFQSGEEKALNLETLPKGVYLLQLQTEDGAVVKRIVKQ